MGKQSKKKKKGFGIDFKRVKKKVGKQLPKAANATRTDFKAKTLVVSSQSVGADKGPEVTARNLTLKDLLGQAVHHNARVRRDAFIGLRDLFHHHPSLPLLHTAAIVDTVAARLTDHDPTVRDALRALLQATLLPGLPEAVLSPFFPILMAHLCSALTHLAVAVRLSALAFLDLFVRHYPRLLAASGYVNQVLGHYKSLLSPTERRGASMTVRLEVLRSLSCFLVAVLRLREGGHGSRSSEAPGAAAVWSPTSRHALGPQRAGTLPQDQRWPSVTPPPLHEYRSAPPPLTPAHSGSSTAPSSALSSDLLRLLLDAWSECTPAALSMTADATTIDCCLHITSALRQLLRRLVPHPAAVPACGGMGPHSPHHPLWPAPRSALGGGDENPSDEGRAHAAFLPILVQQVVGHFPVPAPAVHVRGKVVEDLVSLNISICALMIPFLAPDTRDASVEQMTPLNGPNGPPTGRPSTGRVTLNRTTTGRVALNRKGPDSDTREGGEGGAVMGGLLPVDGGDASTGDIDGHYVGHGDMDGGDGGYVVGSDEEPWVRRVLDYLEGALRGELLPSAGLGQALHRASITASHCSQLLQGLLHAAPVVGPARRSALITAFTAFYEGSTSNATARVACLEAMGLLLEGPDGLCLVPPHLLTRWVRSFPRLLWELKTSDPTSSHCVLRLLLHVARTASWPVAPSPASSPGLSAVPPSLASLLSELRPALVPFFCVPAMTLESDTRNGGHGQQSPPTSKDCGKERRIGGAQGKGRGFGQGKGPTGGPGVGTRSGPERESGVRPGKGPNGGGVTGPSGPQGRARAEERAGRSGQEKHAGGCHGGRPHFGPFIGLPLGTQALAVDLLFHLGEPSSTLLQALATCCLCPDLPHEIAARIIEVLLFCFTAGHITSPAPFISFLLTLLKGPLGSSSWTGPQGEDRAEERDKRGEEGRERREGRTVEVLMIERSAGGEMSGQTVEGAGRTPVDGARTGGRPAVTSAETGQAARIVDNTEAFKVLVTDGGIAKVRELWDPRYLQLVETVAVALRGLGEGPVLLSLLGDWLTQLLCEAKSRPQIEVNVMYGAVRALLACNSPSTASIQSRVNSRSPTVGQSRSCSLAMATDPLPATLSQAVSSAIALASVEVMEVGGRGESAWFSLCLSTLTAYLELLPAVLDELVGFIERLPRTSPRVQAQRAKAVAGVLLWLVKSARLQGGLVGCGLRLQEGIQALGRAHKELNLRDVGDSYNILVAEVSVLRDWRP